MMMRAVQRGVVALLAVWPVAVDAGDAAVDAGDADCFSPPLHEHLWFQHSCEQHRLCLEQNDALQVQNAVSRLNNHTDDDLCQACFFQYYDDGSGYGDCICQDKAEVYWSPERHACVFKETTLTVPSRGALQWYFVDYCRDYPYPYQKDPWWLYTGSALPPPEQWDISAVTDLSFLWPWILSNADSHCHGPLSGVGSWDVSRVTRMKGTFKQWRPFPGETLDLSKWDVRKVTDMSKIFEEVGTERFHGDQIKGLEMWKPINVMKFDEMLKKTEGFHTFLQMWAKVMPLDAQYVWAFENSDYPMTARDKTAFSTQPWVKDITKYDVPKGKLKKMINSWCNSTSDCKDWGCVHLKYWKLHEDETSMEYAAAGLTECHRSLVGMRYWDVGKITDMTALFRGNTVLQDMDLGGWNVRKVTTMFQMFRGARGFTGRGLAQWDPSSVVKAKAMFKKVFTLDQGFIPDFKDRMSRDVETANWLDRASTMSAGSAGSNVETITPGSAPRASAFAASLLAIVTTSFAVTV